MQGIERGPVRMSFKKLMFLRTMSKTLETAPHIDDVDKDQWDALHDHDNPFLKHAFLSLLERSGSVGEDTGWTPVHLLYREGQVLKGAAPVYLRTDSYGEYVFDFAWAQAATRSRVPYYPKLTVAVPFTPATGPRLLVRKGEDKSEIQTILLQGLRELSRQVKAHGVHILLCRDEEATIGESEGYLRRATHQYHFRNPGYGSYEGFLAALRSQSRKQLKKERAKVAGLEIDVVRGDTLSDTDWAAINDLYLHTSERKWGRPYLSAEFFSLAKGAVGQDAVVATCRQGGEIVAMSLSFARGKNLYGRYWGARIEADSLHFELCYHRLIDYAVTHGMRLVEAGAQGEHKVKRGFVPIITHSLHWLEHPGLHDAVSRAVNAERDEMRSAIAAMTTEAPFREDALPAWPPLAGIDLE
jgi:uncharacterized protein